MIPFLFKQKIDKLSIEAYRKFLKAITPEERALRKGQYEAYSKVLKLLQREPIKYASSILEEEEKVLTVQELIQHDTQVANTSDE